MHIRNPGKVRDGLWYLGREESGVYVIEGQDGSMVISGGMSYIVPAVVEQMKTFGIKRASIRKILILHSHFDHVGIIPYLKRSQPDIEIYASARAWEILGMPKAIDTINEFGRNVTERMGMMEAYALYDLDWRDDISGSVVSEGDEIDLGDVTVRIIETPGHSSCLISAYVPQFKALFPSDGGGIPNPQGIITSGNSNFTKFQESLERLKALEVAYYCADHYGYLTRDEAAGFIMRSIQSAKEQRAKIEDAYLKTKDIDLAAKALTNSLYAEHPDYFLTPEVFEGVYRQMVRHIAGAMEP